MCWLKRYLRKNSIVKPCIIFFLIFMGWILMIVDGTRENALGSARTRTVIVQGTPMANPTIAAETANEQLRKLQRDNDRSWQAWFWGSGAALLSTFAALAVGVFGFLRWLSEQHTERAKREDERRIERDKRAEERFQHVVEGLASDREEARIGAAILLRTFLQPDYEQFYTQVFDLAVVHLRLQKSLAERSAFITVFKESFPLARDRRKTQISPFDPRYLDASHVILDEAFLWQAGLGQIYMPWASLRETDLTEANLTEARLWGGEHPCDLYKVKLRKAILREADPGPTNLSEADLSEANLTGAKLWAANLTEAKLWGADLTNAKLCTTPHDGANLSKANLTEAKLWGADLRYVNLNGAELQRAKYNTKVMQEKDEQGNPITIQPTQWPQGFDPQAAGAICVDCKKP